MRVNYSAKFSRDTKKCAKRGLPVEKLVEVAKILAREEVIPAKYRDHSLVGNYVNHRELHLAPDWLLIYLINQDEDSITMVRTGSHSDLF